MGPHPAFAAKRSLLIAVLLVAAVVVRAPERASAEPAAPADAPEVGLAVGERAPAFSLRSQNGDELSLDSLLTDGPIALVFFRSADWCLYCKLQLAQLQSHLDEIHASGGQIVGVSYDSVAALRRFADRRSIGFPLLSDPLSRTIDDYDVRGNGTAGEPGGVARHTTFIIDSTGTIRSKLYQLSYAERPALETLIHAIEDAQDVNRGSPP